MPVFLSGETMGKEEEKSHTKRLSLSLYRDAASAAALKEVLIYIFEFFLMINNHNNNAEMRQRR